eukprot:NODE_3504_length_965_cov_46.406114_g3217_i0.p1 GENE.NODE_3504_length_965_cov_46.406114_g3217_i0~~NODE_3504_length_965_cov_46.406114_g3217_i0.p1  ORF type:complete len:191 (+),score=46.74 NODE_3504_length_965_cov_46.406114_g3217_i0:106-678(+)
MSDGNTLDSLLQQAVAMTDLDGVQKLLEKGHSDISGSDEVGTTLLHVALLAAIEANFSEASVEMIKVLVDAGAHPQQQNKFGASALSCVARSDNPKSAIVFDCFAKKLRLSPEQCDRLKQPRELEMPSVKQLFGAPSRKAIQEKASSVSVCRVCAGPGTQTCSVCRMVRYCSQECQKTDWKFHKLSHVAS